MSRLFKIFLIVVLSVFSTLNLSANDTFFSIEKSSDRIEDLANAGGKYSNKFDDFVQVLQKESLYGDDALTFLDAEYRTVRSTSKLNAYRSFGGNAKVGGPFVTTTKGATRNELAVLDDWNSMRFEAKIEIPTQTKLNVGKVAPQTSDDGLQVLTGGGDQVMLPFQWDTQWVKEIKDLNTGTVYNSVDAFKIDFPNLVD